MEARARRRIGSVNIGVAGEAATAHQLRFRIGAVFEPLRSLQRAGMGGIHVALLAQEWDRCDQQRQLI